MTRTRGFDVPHHVPAPTSLRGALQATRTFSFASVWRRHFPPLLPGHHRGRIGSLSSHHLLCKLQRIFFHPSEERQSTRKENHFSQPRRQEILSSITLEHPFVQTTAPFVAKPVIFMAHLRPHRPGTSQNPRVARPDLSHMT